MADRLLIALSTIACFGCGALLLWQGAETAGMTFIIAGCLGALTWSIEP